MSRTPRSKALFALVGVLASLLPLGFAAPASAARVKTIKVADASIVEGDSGQYSMSFRVTWSGSKGGGGVSVSYATADVEATAGNDYTAKSGTVSLPGGGCRCGTITIAILGDTMSESPETLTVNLSNAVNATISDSQGVGTIYDNEGPPSLVVLDATAAENANLMSFAVIMTSSSSSAQTVQYETGDGTALDAGDYTAASGTLTFTSGETSKTVSVPVVNDTLNEDGESFTLTLSNATVAVTRPEATGTIVDDDDEPTVSVADTSGAEATGVLTFTISLSGASGQEVDVDYATSDDAAMSGADYSAASGTAVIPAGSTSVQVPVQVIDDATFEADEVLALDLSAPFNATILDGHGVGTITNDDAVPTMSIDDVAAEEGNVGASVATFTVSLSNPSAYGASAEWATADGTAAAGSDYVAGTGSVSFDPGVTTQEIQVTVNGDTAYEPNETLTATLSNPAGAGLGSAIGTVTITSDDRAATALTLKASKRTEKVSARGVLESAASTSKVTVTLYKRSRAKWVRVAAKTVSVRSYGDRDADGRPDATYRASFPRPRAGSYRLRAKFVGSAMLEPSSNSLTFTL